jgi:pimeloyl-ACP methyl ester carboxylesterase
VPVLSRAAYVIAPDLPGHGESDVLPAVSFSAIGQAVCELLERLAIGPRFVYLHDWGPPALMVWGRHDIYYFELDEVVSWMRALPRMKAHVLDAGHLLLETHSAEAASLMLDFIERRLTQPRAARR